MGEIVNLRRARKRRTRAEDAKQAEANRAKHGRPAALRRRDEAVRDLETQRLAGHRLEDKGDDR